MRWLGVATLAAGSVLATSSLAGAERTTTPHWLTQSNSACRDAKRGRAAVIAEVSHLPSKTARKTLLRILSGTAHVETGLLAQLRRVDPPASVSAAFDRALVLLETRHIEDARLIVRLERRWNASLLERQTRRDRFLNVRLVHVWQGLRAAACVSYFRVLR
jgi:hypothetical protein